MPARQGRAATGQFLSGKARCIGAVDHLPVDAVSHHFAYAFGVGRNHRATAGHGFDQGLCRCKRR
jgi:hypothetical protein